MTFDNDFDFNSNIDELCEYDDSNDEVRYYQETAIKDEWDQYNSFEDYFSISSIEESGFDFEGC